MKNVLYNIKGFVLCMLLGVLTMLTSCNDDEKVSTEVQLLSMGPSGVQHGDQISFIGQNLDKVTSIVFEPAIEVSQSNFASQSRETITLTVPAAAERGTVVLKTASGDVVSKSVLDFEVPVVISSITQEAKPGTNITISGTMLNWIENVTFPSDLVIEKEDFVSRSQTELVIQVPMEAQTGYLNFETSGTDPMSFTSEEQLIVTLPVITTLSPTSIKHASVLSISGSALDLVTEITFPEGIIVPSEEFESQSESKIEVVVPSATVNGTIKMAVPSGLIVESTQSITIILPNVTSFNPAATDAHVAGATFTLFGTNLDLVKSITFPGAAAPVTTFTNASATQITVTLPAGVQGGSVQLKTIHDFVVPVAVPFGNQLQLLVKIWDDAVGSGFSEWGGWGSTTEWGTAEQLRLGSKAIKVSYPSGNWNGGAQLGNGNVSTAGAANFAFSVYGGAGTDGKKIQILVKTNGGEKTKQITMDEGAWVDVSIPLSEWGNPTTITEMFFQNADFNGTVYIDHIGLK